MHELKVQPIRNGTVIDHITPGQAMNVLKILGLPRPGGVSIISVVMNVPSEAMGRKDIVKVEDRELEPDEVAQIALIAPKASINIVRESRVADKLQVSMPDRVRDLVDCPNGECVTRTDEPVHPEFDVVEKEPVRLRCTYCETTFSYAVPLV